MVRLSSLRICFTNCRGRIVTPIPAHAIDQAVVRLTETYTYAVKDIPSEQTYRDEAVMVYEEKLNVGYRYFATHNVPVLYPFGYCLSYSESRYFDLKVENTDARVTVCVKVENISDRDGKEEARLYDHKEDPAVERPVRELKAFEKVLIERNLRLVAHIMKNG